MLYLEVLKIPNYDNIVKDTVLIPVCFGSSLVESHQKDFFYPNHRNKDVSLQ